MKARASSAQLLKNFRTRRRASTLLRFKIAQQVAHSSEKLVLLCVRLYAYDSQVQAYAAMDLDDVPIFKREEMAERAALSKGEMDVARVLWDIGPATVRVVHEAVAQKRSIDFATVQTYLRRLETKGYASSQLDGRVRVYAARTKPRTVIRETVNDLIERLFGGETMPLVRHLIEERGMGASDIAELRALVERLEQDPPDDRT